MLGISSISNRRTVMSGIASASITNYLSSISRTMRAFSLGLLALPCYAQAVSSADVGRPVSTSSEGRVQDETIRPFTFHASDDELADLRRRIAATTWPSPELVNDASQGVQLATTRELARYWQTDYDWRKVEQRLNALPQFVTTIDGVDIHFIHVRSKNPNALPVIITHGWPGSIIEKMKIIA